MTLFAKCIATANIEKDTKQNKIRGMVFFKFEALGNTRLGALQQNQALPIL